jgi:glycosyltransferase involved in cell wall biosynthesis
VISIVSLIYRSPAYADAVVRSLLEHTPMLGNGAEFHFVANDPTDELLAHLRDQGYPYLLFQNPPRPSHEELFRRGIGAPAYLHGVYRAWNYAAEMAAGDDVCFVNSDMMFSAGWLENLLKHLADDVVVSSQLVERRHPKHGVFPGAYEQNFGTCPADFFHVGFRDFAQAGARDETRPGGAYAPLLFRKRTLLEAGGYPEGNLHNGRNFETVSEYGDRVMMRRLESRGVRHLTAMDSIVYHFKEGEMCHTAR